MPHLSNCSPHHYRIALSYQRPEIVTMSVEVFFGYLVYLQTRRSRKAIEERVCRYIPGTLRHLPHFGQFVPKHKQLGLAGYGNAKRVTVLYLAYTYKVATDFTVIAQIRLRLCVRDGQTPTEPTVYLLHLSAEEIAVRLVVLHLIGEYPVMYHLMYDGVLHLILRHVIQTADNKLEVRIMPSAKQLLLTFISHHTQEGTCPAKPEGKRLQLPLKHQIIKLRKLPFYVFECDFHNGSTK